MCPEMRGPGVDVRGRTDEHAHVIEAGVGSGGTRIDVKGQAVLSVREIHVLRIWSPLHLIAENATVKLLHLRERSALQGNVTDPAVPWSLHEPQATPAAASGRAGGYADFP